MVKQKPPTTGDICVECPSPGLVAKPKDHFGHPSWEFECTSVKEVFLESKGVTISCSVNQKQCCVDDGRDFFVNSPQISPLKNFFDATMRFLDH